MMRRQERVEVTEEDDAKTGWVEQRLNIEVAETDELKEE